MKEKQFVSLVLQLETFEPAYGVVIHQIDQKLSEVFENHEVVIVDNTANQDSYTQIVESTKHLKGLVSVLKLSRHYPIEIAMLAGVDKSIGDFVYQMDSLCLDFELGLFEELFKRCVKGVDILFAAPNAKVATSSKIFYSVFNRVSYLGESLRTERLVLTSRRALNAVVNTKQRFRYQKALFSLSGFSREWIFYEPKKTTVFAERTLSQKLGLAIDLFISYSAIGFKIGLVLSSIFFSFAVLIAIYAIASLILRQDLIMGWTSLMMFLTISFGGIFLLLGIMSEYLRHILLETQGTPLYIIKSFHSMNQLLKGKKKPSAEVIPLASRRTQTSVPTAA